MSDRNPYAGPPSTHTSPAVGCASSAVQYHTETAPCTRIIEPDELTGYIQTPTTIVGKKFIPKDGEDIWEVMEVTFGKGGWSSIVQFEGHDEKHRMIFEDFVRMLKQGTLNVVELE